MLPAKWVEIHKGPVSNADGKNDLLNSANTMILSSERALRYSANQADITVDCLI